VSTTGWQHMAVTIESFDSIKQFVSLCWNMDYRARGSWIGNMRGRLGNCAKLVMAEVTSLVYWSVYLAL